jgi:hypothetical protein
MREMLHYGYLTKIKEYNRRLAKEARDNMSL